MNKFIKNLKEKNFGPLAYRHLRVLCSDALVELFFLTGIWLLGLSFLFEQLKISGALQNNCGYLVLVKVQICLVVLLLL